MLVYAYANTRTIDGTNRPRSPRPGRAAKREGALALPRAADPNGGGTAPVAQPTGRQRPRPLDPTRTPMIFCGIDPGVDGAAAMIDTDTGAVHVIDLPQGPNGIDPVALRELLHDAWGVRSVWLEDNRANGRNGSLANFSMGRCVGLIIATVLLSDSALWRVKPVEWQRSVGLSNVKATER